MRVEKWVAWGFALFLASSALVALAQAPGVPTLLLASPTGLERIDVNGLGPQIESVTINQVRNSEGYVLVAAGTTVNTTIPNTAAVAIATGAITTWNVILPTAPYDGEVAKVTCPGGTASTIAVSATLPASVAVVGGSFTTCSSTSDAAWHYAASTNTWYRTE